MTTGTRATTSPTHVKDYARALAQLARLRAFRLPAVATLRGIGFRFLYPTLDHGLQQVLGALHE